MVNLDEKARNLLDLAKKKRDFAQKDKEESLKQISRQFDALHKRLEERKAVLCQAVSALAESECSKIDALVDSLTAVKERSASMFTPITSSTAIGYARSVEKVLDFINDMKDVQLPTKLGTEGNGMPKVMVHVSEELVKQIDNLGTIQANQGGSSLNDTSGATANPFVTKISSTLGKQFLNQIKSTSPRPDFSGPNTNDFSLPKNKLAGSRILPEAAQSSTKILNVLPHFKDNKLIYRWTPV